MKKFLFLCFTVLLLGSNTGWSQAIACIGQVNVSVDASCTFTPSSAMFVTSGTATTIKFWRSTNPSAITTANLPFTSMSPVLVLARGAWIYEASDAQGNRCWGNMLLEDKI